jgi:glycerophosphoryl diester phosphodiesterase
LRNIDSVANGYAPYDKLVIGGHRGAGCTDKAPFQDRAALVPSENSLESVVHAFNIGADYVEIDVVISKDGIPICLHNVVARDHFFGSEIPKVPLNELTYHEILKYSSGRGKIGKVASLAEMLEKIAQAAPNSIPWSVNIELKGLQGSNQPWEGANFIEAVANTIKNGPLAQEKILFSSFALANIIAMSHRLPESKYGFLFSEGRSYSFYSNKEDDFHFRFLPFNKKWLTTVLSTWQTEASKLSCLGYLHPEATTLTDEILLLAAANKLGINSWPYKEHLNEERLTLYRDLIGKCLKLGIPLSIITDDVSTIRILSEAYLNHRSNA